MGKFEIEETAIRKLSELLKENDLTEIEIKEDKKVQEVNPLTRIPSCRKKY